MYFSLTHMIRIYTWSSTCLYLASQLVCLSRVVYLIWFKVGCLPVVSTAGVVCPSVLGVTVPTLNWSGAPQPNSEGPTKFNHWICQQWLCVLIYLPSTLFKIEGSADRTKKPHVRTGSSTQSGKLQTSGSGSVHSRGDNLPKNRGGRTTKNSLKTFQLTRQSPNSTQFLFYF